MATQRLANRCSPVDSQHEAPMETWPGETEAAGKPHESSPGCPCVACELWTDGCPVKPAGDDDSFFVATAVAVLMG